MAMLCARPPFLDKRRQSESTEKQIDEQQQKKWENRRRALKIISRADQNSYANCRRTKRQAVPFNQQAKRPLFDFRF